MLRLKGCNRCGGDLALDTDPGGYQEWSCLQCGRSAGDNGGVPFIYSSPGRYFEQGQQRHTYPRNLRANGSG